MSKIVESPEFCLAFCLYDDAERTDPTDREILAFTQKVRSFVIETLQASHGDELEDVQVDLCHVYETPDPRFKLAFELSLCATFGEESATAPGPQELYDEFCKADFASFMSNYVIQLKNTPFSDVCEATVRPLQ